MRVARGLSRIVSRVGLRWQLVAALVLVSGITLGVAALTLLSPLEHRLRSDELKGLTDTALAVRPEFSDLSASDVSELTPQFRSLVADLRGRTRARIVVVDTAGRPYYDTDPVDQSFSDASEASVTGASRAQTAVSGFSGEIARVAVPLRVRGGTRYVLLLRRPLSDATAAAQTVARSFLIAAMIGLATAVLIGFGIATTLLRRLRRLRQGALALADGGLGGDGERGEQPSFDVSGHDEIGDLGRAFTTMQNRLARQEQARRAFVATASHELRTPLAGLRGMLELLEEDLAGGEPNLDDARRQLAKAQDQSRRLASLASDLLDLSRLDAGIEFRAEPLELSDLARSVLGEFEPRTGDRTLAVHSDRDSGNWALGDPGAIARIVRILVDNALRFAPPGTEVSLRVEGDDAQTRVVVTDSGPGVASEDRTRIFERFQRGRPPGGDGSLGGFGLGLAIGRELARGMHGELTLLETAVGASFELSLPAAGDMGDDWNGAPDAGIHRAGPAVPAN